MIHVSRLEDKLIYSVYDTGNHADEAKIHEALEKPSEGSHGLALYNINTRIRLKFGKEYGVEYHRPQDGGSVFVVKQPLMTDEEVKGTGTENDHRG